MALTLTRPTRLRGVHVGRDYQSHHLALYARFRSRQEHTFAEKMLSAMRFGFGGHVEGQEPIDPEPRPKDSQRHSAAQQAAEQYRGRPSDPRMQQTARVVLSPPRRQAKPADPSAHRDIRRTGDPALYNLSRTPPVGAK